MIETGLLDFFQWINGLENREYLLSVIAYGSAPTLLAHKPSTLLNLKNSSKALYTLWHHYKHDVCSTLGLDFYELKEGARNICVLFYKERCLETWLSESHNRLFLEGLGYIRNAKVHECLLMLKDRFRNECPHEIGLFLGFPVKDVMAFIENKGRNSLLSCYWKVYDNVEHAKQIFILYDEARRAMISRIREIVAK